MKNIIKTTHSKSIRDKFIIFLFENSKNIYRNKFKKNKKAWDLSLENLAKYPKDSLAYDLYIFLCENNFQLEEKFEAHDIYHILTNYPTTAIGEIELSAFNIGSGKKSIYTFAVAFIGSIIMIDQLPKIGTAFKKGKKASNYTKWDFEYLLSENTDGLKALLFKTKTLNNTLFI